MSASTETPAPVVYARKSQPILKPELIEPSSISGTGDDSLQPQFAILTPAAQTAEPLVISETHKPPAEGETDIRILNAALTALQNVNSSNFSAEKESPRFIQLIPPARPSESQVHNNIKGMDGAVVASKSVPRRSIPPKKQQWFSCPSCLKAFLNEQSLDAHDCNPTPQSTKPQRIETNKEKKRRSLSVKKTALDSTTAMDFQSSNQVEKGLPLKKRGRPPKNPKLLTHDRPAKLPKKQVFPDVVTKPSDNGNIVVKSIPQSPSARNDISQVETNADPQQGFASPPTTSQDSEATIQSNANSGHRSQRKRNLPKCFENMVMDDNLMMGSANRGSRSPMTPGTARKACDDSSAETLAQGMPFVKMQKMSSLINPSESLPLPQASKPPTADPVTPSSDCATKDTNIVPPRSMGRVRKPPPSKDLEVAHALKPMAKDTKLDKKPKSERRIANDKASSGTARGNSRKIPKTVVTSQQNQSTAKSTCDLGNTKATPAVSEVCNPIEKLQSTCMPSPPPLTKAPQVLVNKHVEQQCTSVIKTPPVLKPHKREEGNTDMDKDRIRTSTTISTNAGEPLKISKIIEKLNNNNINSGIGNSVVVKGVNSTPDMKSNLKGSTFVKQDEVISISKTAQPQGEKSIDITPPLNVAHSDGTRMLRKRRLVIDTGEDNETKDISKTIANGDVQSPVKRARQSVLTPVASHKISSPKPQATTVKLDDAKKIETVGLIAKSATSSKITHPQRFLEVKHEEINNVGKVGRDGIVLNGFGTTSGPIQPSFVGMPRLLNQSGYPSLEDSEDSSDDEDPNLPASATASNCSSSRPNIKDMVIRFLENKISNRNMLRIREELMQLKQNGNYFKLTKTAPMAAGLVHDMFCQSFGIHDSADDEMQ